MMNPMPLRGKGFGGIVGFSTLMFAPTICLQTQEQSSGRTDVCGYNLFRPTPVSAMRELDCGGNFCVMGAADAVNPFVGIRVRY
jgi:hypothetical protein